MKDVQDKLRRLETYRRLAATVRKGGSLSAEGLWGSSTGLLAATLAEDVGGFGVAVLPRLDQAEEFAEDIETFAPGLVSFFPAWETFDPDEMPDPDIVSRQLLLLRQLTGRRGEGERARLIVTPVAAVVQQVPGPDGLERATMLLQRGAEQSPEALAEWLVNQRYTSALQAEVPGEFTRRGGIVDVFPFGAAAPCRVEFFGDTIESLRTFDPETQVSTDEVERCEVMAPYNPAASPPTRMVSLFDYLPQGAWLMMVEAEEVLERAAELPLEQGGGNADAGRRAAELLAAVMARMPTVRASQMPGAETGETITFEVHSIQRAQGLQAIMGELEEVMERATQSIVLCENEGERSRFLEVLKESAPDARDRLDIRIGKLSRGFEWVDIGVALLPHHEIFNRYRIRRTVARYRHTAAVDSFADLDPGDCIVHYHHGIGRFRGITTVTQDERRQECLEIEYHGGAILYVPVTRVDLVQKYIGPSEHRPPLNKLGSGAWEERREKARLAAEELAGDLLATQAARQAQEGIVYPSDSQWQHEFAAAFIYQETDDQATVDEEIRRDMQSPRPMDRLVCGDVGYGKTELAMRAAFRCVTHGRQVAVLVPTTILAQQHYRTFRDRMADYPVRIDVLSRFRTDAEQRHICEDLALGRIDVIIGTHRLLQRDVQFADLGLAIVDEEQRFGVRHKEHFKQFRRTLDVLTLTATPIPRTLHLALLGLKDISSLNTPPRDRLAIHTRLWRFSPNKVRQAILHEMARDGQVFFVHDRIINIEKIAAIVREAAPEARVLVGHGRLPERQLQERMQQFVRGGADVLVCTTIIESGLDIPNANTIIINQAHHFGLAELHQLRGRVGRYKHRAYAYLMIPERGPVTPIAEKRLKAIEEYAELGAGFRIALRDLEIRGAGNILGAEQSGHILAVGYDLYCRLLATAVRKTRNQPTAEPVEVMIGLQLESYLPQAYVPEVRHRMEFYRRLSRATEEADVGALAAALRDRFGRLPREAENLLLEARLRIRARAAAIRAVFPDEAGLRLRTRDLAVCEKAVGRAPGGGRIIDERTILLLLSKQLRAPEDRARYLLSVLPAAAPAGAAEVNVSP